MMGNIKSKYKVVNDNWNGYILKKYNNEYQMIIVKLKIDDNFLIVDRDNKIIKFNLDEINPPQIYMSQVLLFDKNKRAVTFHVDNEKKFIDWIKNFIKVKIEPIEWTMNKSLEQNQNI